MKFNDKNEIPDTGKSRNEEPEVGNRAGDAPECMLHGFVRFREKCAGVF